MAVVISLSVDTNRAIVQNVLLGYRYFDIKFTVQCYLAAYHIVPYSSLMPYIKWNI